MRRYLLGTALALVTVWASGCVVVDADKVESRTPVAVRSDDCVICQGHDLGTAGAPADERGW